MFSQTSTPCFLTPGNRGPEYKLRVYVGDRYHLKTFEQRFEHMLQQCNMDRAQLARALSGHGQQKITNWFKRGRVGSSSRREVSELTGVSTDWLNDAIGEAFPAGARKPKFIKEIPASYEVRTTVALTPRELALVENYRASSERFRRVVDEQIAASAESGVKDDAS